MKNSQSNFYQMYDSMGRRTKLYIGASNIKEANEKAKKAGYFNLHPYGKMRREYCYGGLNK